MKQLKLLQIIKIYILNIMFQNTDTKITFKNSIYFYF